MPGEVLREQVERLEVEHPPTQLPREGNVDLACLELESASGSAGGGCQQHEEEDPSGLRLEQESSLGGARLELESASPSETQGSLGGARLELESAAPSETQGSVAGARLELESAHESSAGGVCLEQESSAGGARLELESAGGSSIGGGRLELLSAQGSSAGGSRGRVSFPFESASQEAERGSYNSALSPATVVECVGMDTPVKFHEFPPRSLVKALSIWIGAAMLTAGFALACLLLAAEEKWTPVDFDYVLLIGLLLCILSAGLWIKVGWELRRAVRRCSRRTVVQHRVWACVKFQPMAQAANGKFHAVAVKLSTCTKHGSQEIEVFKQAELQHLQPEASNCCHSSCSCCLHEFQESEQLALLFCGHVFCEPCIARWAATGLENSATCPVCRTSFSLAEQE
eukprot:TRINITY_DN41222_c0_g1_i1.p1 TRINITY_DN41222_c0_g1~~TRINITY_DN41222_c0_g1_i1.p1  ORF type:complete len:429 (-),score=76.36 TRINITY_DN41222_c0_g1_i1:43-1245(-)